MRWTLELRELLHRVDHTLLKPEAAWPQIEALCGEAVRYETAAVCIPPSFVARAAAALAGRVPVCTVIGFPTGYSVTAAKCLEAETAIRDGAAEVDMVVNLGWVKEGRYDLVLSELRAVRAAAQGNILKVIIETCLLTGDEKLRLCELVSEAGADFIKTSTGFSRGGATVEDVALLAAHVAPGVRVKAAGGIATLADAEAMVRAGAARLGTSRLVQLAKEAARL